MLNLTYDQYQLIFYIGAALCGVMLLLSVLLFFVYRIPKVIGDLTGSTARKAIENIRAQNESTGNKVHKTSAVNKERGKITDKISPSGRLIRNPSAGLAGGMVTEKIASQRLTAEETTVLNADEGTTVLTPEMTPGNETTVLSPEMDFGGNETTVLNAPVMESAGFAIEYEITFVHSNEIIS